MRTLCVVMVVAGCWRSSSQTTPREDPEPYVMHGKNPDAEMENDPVDAFHQPPIPETTLPPVDRNDPMARPRPDAGAPPPSGRPRRALGQLTLKGKATKTLPSTHEIELDGACVRDQARLVVEDNAHLTFLGTQPIVIAGGGLTPAPGVTHLHVRIDVQSAADVYILFDNVAVPIEALVWAPRSQVHIAITGSSGLTLVKGGKMAAAHHYAGWGLPSTFPTCP